MPGPAEQITVLGAGLGGLCVALALARAGRAVRVLEQAPELTEVGAGIQVSPNGAAVLCALGLAPALERIGTHARAVDLREHRRGRRVTRLDLSLAQHGNTAPYIFVHRADLLAELARACRDSGVVLDLGCKVEAVEPLQAGARLQIAGRAPEECGVVVGADGLHSVARAAVAPGAAPRFTGQVAWRALVPGDGGLEPGTVTVVMAPGRHLVLYPLRGGQLLNIVAVEARAGWTEEGWSLPGDPDALRAAFAGLGPRWQAILGQVTACNLWGLFRHEVPARWSRGGVVLMGDAVHPTLPFLAQGANMAFEDAWVLAACMTGQDSIANAWNDYEKIRAERVGRIVDAANRNAWLYHLSNPVLRLGAHAVLGMGGALFPGLPLSRFDWLYGVDVTKTVDNPNITVIS
ncbi:MAG: FAD-dependent monooxygenase [Rhodobacteraceae bacterium]|nr:FAD-dependent monooxygenase [Paracoccaceae bacterium]